MTTNQNTVELLGTYGGDITHATSAWTSTTRDLTEEKKARIPKLLHFLAVNKHHTPFEKSSLHFLCNTDIATHIHLLKHRIGVSINGESARYKEFRDDKFYIPDDWNQAQKDEYIEFMDHAISKYHSVLKSVEEEMLAQGLSPKKARDRAKESARFYLPYGKQIDCDVQFNFRSFMHFAGLRYAVNAQKEVRDLASEMLRQVIAVGDFEHSLRAFGFIDEQGKLVEPLKNK